MCISNKSLSDNDVWNTYHFEILFLKVLSIPLLVSNMMILSFEWSRSTLRNKFLKLSDKLPLQKLQNGVISLFKD
jgi:hypothetical protein